MQLIETVDMLELCLIQKVKSKVRSGRTLPNDSVIFALVAQGSCRENVRKTWLGNGAFLQLSYWVWV